MMPRGIKTMMRRHAIVRAGYCRARTPLFIGSAIISERYADGSPVNAG
jgi:hypothetical protein